MTVNALYNTIMVKIIDKGIIKALIIVIYDLIFLFWDTMIVSLIKMDIINAIPIIKL